jgi:murein DD-endopeptidase MepM/ murein hydrolase activator NlpD
MRWTRTRLIAVGLLAWGGWAGFSAEPRIRAVFEQPAALLDVPVEGVKPRDLRDSWGAPRSGGRKHQGIDIFARKGTPIRSATSGVVWRIGQNRLGGNVVWVLGPGWEMHYYAHLDRFADLRAGTFVRRGDVLGTVGNTGNARHTPPHLHYGIYTRQGAVNPYPRLVPTLKASSSGLTHLAPSPSGRRLG